MGLSNIPFQTIDWKNVPRTEHVGETGTSFWQTIQFDGLRIRVVEYTKNYLANHCLEIGEPSAYPRFSNATANTVTQLTCNASEYLNWLLPTTARTD